MATITLEVADDTELVYTVTLQCLVYVDASVAAMPEQKRRQALLANALCGMDGVHCQDYDVTARKLLEDRAGIVQSYRVIAINEQK